MFALVSFASALSVLSWRTLFVLQLGPLDVSVICESTVLLSCGSPITSHIIFSMFSSLISSIPSSPGPSPSTTKSLHLAFLSLWLNLTVPTPSCLISDSFMFLIELNCFVASSAAHVDLRNTILKTLNGIRLPSLPVSILYDIHALFDWCSTIDRWILLILHYQN